MAEKNNCFIDKNIIDREMDTAREISRIFKEKGRVGERAPGYFIQTFGCQQNEADSERLAGIAESMGYVRVSDPQNAELILVNTCAIREHAEKKALSIIGGYKHIKDANPDVIIGVGGCMVTQSHRSEKLKQSYPYVSFVFDTGACHMLPSLVKGALSKGSRKFIHSDEYLIAEGMPASRESKHSVWLSIMYGCNNFCSYCIVPYVRGRERSRRPEDIIEEAKRLVEGGAKNITLLGQNVNSYGKDADFSTDIAELMHKICAIPGDFKLRFMTSHPKDASDELIDAMAEEEKIIKHFHLPIQSGSDEILAKMNRRYTSEHYLKIIEKLKKKVPDVSITSDIIVGFPGETEKNFEDTMTLLREVRYDMVFSFIYSPRKGTPAEKMEGRVPHEVSAERFERLLSLQNGISEERNKRFVGKTLRLLADEISRSDPSMLTGRGEPARPVHFKASSDLIGDFVNVKVTDAGAFSINAELV